MARPTPRDNDTLYVVLDRLKKQIAALAGRAYVRIGTGWKIHQVGENLVATHKTQATVLATPQGNCAQTMACVADGLDATLAYDGDTETLGVRRSGDSGNALGVGGDGGLFVSPPPPMVGRTVRATVTAINSSTSVALQDWDTGEDIPAAEHLTTYNPVLYNTVLATEVIEGVWIVIGKIGAYVPPEGGGGDGGPGVQFIQNTTPTGAETGDLWLQT